ncbi:MAG TPA: efflux RND transporter periplasmic adaptor subunit [Acidobacteriaceae bacterium]|nr:efflux RND transporter periplasmic adaptor subunit [Acidobacteriaceae bacterium]
MAEKSASSARGWIVTLVVAVVVVVLIVVAKSALKEKVEVRVAKAARTDLVSFESTNGQVEAIQDYQAHVAAPGVIKKVYVEVGEHVQRGAELMRMDDTDAASRLATAQAALDAAIANLQNMRAGGTNDEMLGQKSDLAAAQSQQKQTAAALSTIQALQATGSASANEVAVAQQHLTDANAKVAQLQARIHNRYSTGDLSVQHAQVEQARAAVMAAKAAYASVDFRAPFAGTVYSVPVSDFDFVQPSDALLNLADLNHLQVTAYFDEPEIGRLRVGQPVRIVWEAKPDAVWHGRVLRAPTTIITYNNTRHVGECIISVDDAQGDLLPNTTVTVTVTVSELHNVLTLPREALRPQGMKNFVYRVVDGHLHQTPVEVGASNNTRIQITAGLSEGDAVALGSPTNAEFQEGLQVKALPQ